MVHRRSRSRVAARAARRTGALVLAAGLLIAAVPAQAEKEQAPVLSVVAPTGDSVGKGTPPQFKVKITKAGSRYRQDPYAVFVAVSRRRATDATGVLTGRRNVVYLAEMKRDGSAFVARPRKRSFPEYWLNTPREYYWQPYIVRCEVKGKDCKQEIPPRRLTVRAR
jgi:hypothetical protein